MLAGPRHFFGLRLRNYISSQSSEDPPRFRGMHRLRKCARACLSGLPVDQVEQIRSVECTACMACVAACPAQDALQFSLAPRKAATPAERWRYRTLRPATASAVLAFIFFGLVLAAKVSGHWGTNLPREIYEDQVCHAREAGHPSM